MPGRLKSKYEFAILKEGGGGYFLSVRVKVSQINSLKKKNRRFEYKCTRCTFDCIFVYLTGNNPYFALFC